jgi:hypothetical protein
VHRTEARREYAYDAKPHSGGKLVAAPQEARGRGWIVPDMARYWNKVFTFEP